MVDFNNINAVREKLSEIQGHFKSGLTGEDKVFIDRVYYILMGKNVSNKGCGNCYHDAFVLCSLKLREMSELPSFDYVLKAGAVLVEPMTGKPYIGGIPNEVAEKFLKINKNKWLPLFAKVPEDLDARLAEPTETSEGKAEEKAETGTETEETNEEKPTDGKRKAGRPRKNL